MKLIYLDNAATTKCLSGAAEAVAHCLIQEYGNPSSLHFMGLKAEKTLHTARDCVARLLGTEPEGIIFTSGGTEANILAIRGALGARPGRILVSPIEHPSVREVFLALAKEGWQVQWLPLDEEGLVDLDALAQALTQPVQMVSVMAVNNELGLIQPLPEIGALIRRLQPQTLFHTDAVQGPGKTPYLLGQTGADLISISAHKFHGPKGIGALYVSRGDLLKPLFLGGGQQGNLRSGTENVPGAAGMGEAARQFIEHGPAWYQHIAQLNQKLSEGIIALGGVILSSQKTCAPHILGAYLPGYRGEIILQALSAKGICITTGSACSGKKGKGSHLAEALNLPEEARLGQLRFSFSHFNTPGEVDETLAVLRETLTELAFVRGRGSRNVR